MENNANPIAVNISIPAAVTVFHGEIYQIPRIWAARLPNLIYYRGVDKAGDFAASLAAIEALHSSSGRTSRGLTCAWEREQLMQEPRLVERSPE